MELQVYVSRSRRPMGSMLLSTVLAAVPIVVLLGAIGILEIKAHPSPPYSVWSRPS